MSLNAVVYGNSYKIDGQVCQAKEITFNESQSKFVINGRTDFERIPLSESHFKNEDWELSEHKEVKGLQPSKNYFQSGKYCVKYNSQKYYMSYLDQLELFRKSVVLN